jgi:hypothetical protein
VSLAIKYESVDDARMRLRQTIVLYKGTPVYIQDVARGTGGDEILRVLFHEIPHNVNGVARRIADLEEAENPKRKYISSKYFDIAPFKLGYVNRQDKTGAFYCSRMPNRTQKQGLCAENFKALDNQGNQVPFQEFLNCKETLAMIAGNYPSFDRAVKSLEKVPSIAFHREFCLVKDSVISSLIYLYHKGNKVGMYTPATKEIALGEKFKCLKESLQEMHMKVGAC